MQHFTVFYMKYFSHCRNVAFVVWDLKTSFGPIEAKKLAKQLSPEPCIQFSQTTAHFICNDKLNKMYYLNFRIWLQRFWGLLTSFGSTESKKLFKL